MDGWLGTFLFSRQMHNGETKHYRQKSQRGPEAEELNGEGEVSDRIERTRRPHPCAPARGQRPGLDY